MHVKILIPTPLRSYVGGANEVTVDAGTVADALSRLVERHGQLKKHLYAEDGRLRSFVNVYVNDEDIRYLSKGETPLAEKDVVPNRTGATLRAEAPFSVDTLEPGAYVLRATVLVAGKKVGATRVSLRKSAGAIQ